MNDAQKPTTAAWLTQAVLDSAASARDERTRTIFRKLVGHLHAFVREVELTPQEWMAGIQFLTATGQQCDDVRQEFVLLSDTLGVSTLVDAIAAREASAGTESSVLGPFFTTDAHDIPAGESIAKAGSGETLFVSGQVRDTAGRPIVNASIEVWETDGTGNYDVQYVDRSQPNCRGRLHTDAEGAFRFRAVLPVSYSIPGDGRVGEMLAALGRHTMRPAHLHFKIEAPSFLPLTTALYVKGDPYLDGDAVFGVKPSLVSDFVRHDDPAGASERGCEPPFYTLEADFVLVHACSGVDGS
ncbi:MAG: dioxygenase [Vulcanimicrobiaceae bacterium]